MRYDYQLDSYVGTASDGRTVVVDADEVTDKVCDMIGRDGLKLADLPDWDTGATYLRYLSHALEQLSSSMSRQGVTCMGKPGECIVGGDGLNRQAHRLL